MKERTILIAIIALLVGSLIGSLTRPVFADVIPITGPAAVNLFGEMYSARWNDDASTNVVSVGTSSAQYTVPDINDAYRLCAVGQSVQILCGSNPTVVLDTTRSMILPEGTCSDKIRFSCVDANGDKACDARKCAHIAAATGGYLMIYQYERD